MNTIITFDQQSDRLENWISTQPKLKLLRTINIIISSMLIVWYNYANDSVCTSTAVDELDDFYQH